MDERQTETPYPARVLIADDDADFRTLIARRAARMGLEIVEAEDGRRAIEILREQHFDVILADLYMPGATGLDVIEAAQRIDPDVPAIILTGSASIETAVEALRAGVYDYMIKPLESMAAFELSVSHALDHHRLIKENARLFTEVQRLAVTDPLTGLFNRHKLNEVLELEVERAKRYGRRLSVIMLDMDGMKQINDTYGHPAGDEVLRRVAWAIRSQVRRVDLATRYGGDEFLIVLPEAGLDEARTIGQRICAEITRQGFQEIRFSASAGVAEWVPHLETPEEFLQVVDRSLYRSKRRAGREVQQPVVGDP
jgi:diguanylate cyclase (GGDEF)-like protein